MKEENKKELEEWLNKAPKSLIIQDIRIERSSKGLKTVGNKGIKLIDTGSIIEIEAYYYET